MSTGWDNLMSALERAGVDRSDFDGEDWQYVMEIGADTIYDLLGKVKELERATPAGTGNE